MDIRQDIFVFRLAGADAFVSARCEHEAAVKAANPPFLGQDEIDALINQAHEYLAGGAERLGNCLLSCHECLQFPLTKAAEYRPP